MRIWRNLFLIIILVVGFGCKKASTSPGAETGIADDYMPLSIGNRWMYESDKFIPWEGDSAKNVSWEVKSETLYNGDTLYHILILLDGNSEDIYMSYDNEGNVFQYGDFFEGPYCVLKNPIEVGNKWYLVESDTTSGYGEILGQEEIEINTPSGVLIIYKDCVKVKYTIEDRHYILWYAKGTGIVKTYNLYGCNETTQLIDHIEKSIERR